MKAFATIALAAVAYATSLERKNAAYAAKDYTLMGKPQLWEWSVNVQTIVDEDTGGQWV